jgi:hypothetical protein
MLEGDDYMTGRSEGGLAEIRRDRESVARSQNCEELADH